MEARIKIFKRNIYQIFTTFTGIFAKRSIRDNMYPSIFFTSQLRRKNTA